MNGINRVFLMGYLGSNPELQTSKGGKPYVRLNVATHHQFKQSNGEIDRNTVWHKVTVWGKNAQRCQESLEKGSPLAVEGYLSQFNYVKEDGSDATATAITAREIHFIGRRPKPRTGPNVQSNSATEMMAEAIPF